MTGNRKKSYAAILWLILWLAGPCRVQAAPPPHLIQTVTQQDVYEGMVALGMLRCPVLETPDCGRAFENVKDCVVRVDMGNAYGSGIVWELTADRVIVATNRHVLAYWEDTDSIVYFPQGYYMDAGILGVSEQYDVGFLAVDTGQFTYEELEKLRYAAAEQESYERLEEGAEIFCAGAGPETGEWLFYEAGLEDRERYLADFGTEMLYGHGYARAGMSGGGIFDGYGRLAGMVTGGTMKNEIAGVPLPAIEEAYREVLERL